jgi:hypothetical protein
MFGPSRHATGIYTALVVNTTSSIGLRLFNCVKGVKHTVLGPVTSGTGIRRRGASFLVRSKGQSTVTKGVGIGQNVKVGSIRAPLLDAFLPIPVRLLGPFRHDRSLVPGNLDVDRISNIHHMITEHSFPHHSR